MNYLAIKIEDIDLTTLNVGDYFVIKKSSLEFKHTSWFNGKSFDSATIEYVLININDNKFLQL